MRRGTPSRPAMRWLRDMFVDARRSFFEPLRAHPIYEGEARRVAHRRKRLGLLVIVGIGGAVGAAQFVLPPPWGERIATGPGEFSSARLEDGSVLRALPNTIAYVRYNDKIRRIYLEQGGVSADVAHAVLQPFEVTTRAGTARAVGTQFSMNYSPPFGAKISVEEGRVQVIVPADAEARAPAHTLLLSAGEAAVLAGGRVTDVRRQVYVEQETLFVEGATIGAVAAQLSARGPLKIVVDDPRIASIVIPSLMLTHFEPRHWVKRIASSPNIAMEERDGVVHLSSRPGPCASWLNCVDPS
jgi:ferric-dicitrate binding protein FerR (iron transport regulator)